MKRQTLMKSTLCLLMALVCNVAWAQTSTDGPIVTFTNLQKNGTTFTLYISDNGELVASTDDAVTLGEKAQFRATLQSNGKYTFYNEAKGLYMIWRNKNANDGYDGGDGVMATYNSTYCDWALNFERNMERSGEDETFYYITGKRKNGTSDGTLILHKTNYFETWSSGVAWHDNYSNQFRINVVGSVRYTFTDIQTQQQYTGTTTSFYPVAVAGGVTLSNQKWSKGHFTADFTYNVPVSDNESTKQVIIGSFNDFNNKYFADGTSVKANRNSSAPLPSNVNAKNYLWAFYPEIVDGIFKFKIKNIGTGCYLQSSTAASDHSGDEVSLVENVADATSFELTTLNQLINSKGYRLSNGSTSGDEIKHMGTFNTNHNGTKNKIVNAQSYTLTLADGSTFVGENGVQNLLGGSYTYTNGAWSDNGYSATVDFDPTTLPFPISTAEKVNPTMISSFKTGGGGSGPGRFKWYSLDNADDVVAKLDVAATLSTFKNFSWAIYASLENGAFAYSIKNVAKDKYIYSEASYTADNGSHGDNVVILSDTPTKFQLTTDGENRFYYVVNSVNQYLSLNSTGTADPQQLGIHAKAHNGTTNSFHTPTYNLSSKDELVSGGIYAFVTSRGWVGANDGDVAIATVKTSVTPAASTDNVMFQWALYQSKNGNYYLYNLGKQKFLGVPSQDMASIPLADEPMGKKLTFKDIAGATNYPIMFSPNNTHAVSQNANDGLFGWAGGWNRTDDAGSNHNVTYIGELTADQLKTIADLVEAYDKSLPIKVEVEGSWEGNPNTHFGNLTVTTGSAVATTKLALENMEVNYVEYAGAGDVFNFTREYRGFEFQGFFLGEKNLGKSFTLTEEQEANITEQNPLVAKFTATDEVTLFYDDDEFSYRIPAITTTGTGRIFAVSDYRHNLDDIGRDKHGTGTMRIDLVARYSDNNGETWSEAMTIAAGDNSKTGSYLRAFGDAAIAAVGENIVVMAAAGDQMYPYATVASPNKMARIFSSDNGKTWAISEMTTKMYTETGLIPDGVAAFFGSGKMVVDANFNGSGKARIYGALLVRRFVNDDYSNYNNYVVYSDDLGETWNILGGSQTPVAGGDEPKAEILPNGQILLSARRGGGRVFNVFTYTDKANNAGTWDTAANGCGNGGSNATNGEIFCVDAKKPDGTAVKLLMQSQPKGGGGQYDRKDVTIWYKEIDANTTYTTATIKDNWIEGLQVSHQQSSYSAVTMQPDGKIALFFEEAPCYADDYTKGYCMVYLPLTIEEITKNKYFSLNADLTTERNISVVLIDAQGNEYRQQVTSTLGGVATKLTTDYPFITLGDNATLESADGESFTYTNTVTLPFKVSNENTTVWHNIYYPINTNEHNYPVYMSAIENEGVVKISYENAVYGNSSFNTQANSASISWAFYQEGTGLTFKLKNKLNGKYVKTTSEATSNNGGENVQYTENIAEAAAFVPSKEGHSSNYLGEYSLKVGDGFICVWTVSDGRVTYTTNKGHKGAWVKFVEAPDFETLFAEVNTTLDMIGDGLGQYTVSEANATTAEAAKVAMENSGNVKLNDLIAYKDLLTGATLNMPVAGQYFRVAYDYGGNAGKLYMQSTASSVKGLEFTAATDAASIWVYYDGALYSYTAGQCLREHEDDRGLQAVGGKTTATFSASGRAKGKYTLQCGSYVHANTSNGKYYTDHCSGNNCAQHDLILEEVTELPVAVSAAGYATFIAPVALEIPDDVKAYTGALNADSTWLTLSEVNVEVNGGIIPANTGVVLKAAEGSYNFNIVADVDPITSHLVGSTAAKVNDKKTEAQIPYYTLQSDGNGGVVFKQFNGDNLAGSKAYLDFSANPTAAQSISIRFEGTTDIEHSTLNPQPSTQIYDLMGRRVEAITKGGIYIVNGKKVIK